MSEHLAILASYPKTGSTWLRKIIAEIVSPGESADAVVPSFFKRFPDVKEYEVQGRKLGFVKTHLYPQHPNFGMLRGQISSIVTIYRHPMDVLLSSLNYAKVKDARSCFIGNIPKSVEQIIADGEIQHYIDDFLNHDGLNWYSAQSGPFSLYQRRWRSMAERFPYFEICYEDMVAAPHKTLADLVKFMFRERRDEEVEHILLQAEARTKQDGQFYWRRQAFGYRALLTQSLCEDIDKRFRSVLDELGYGG